MNVFCFPLLLFLADSSITDSSSLPKIPPSPGKRMALSSTGKEALNQTHPRSKSISFSPSSQPPSKIKNQNKPIQDQESKSTHLRSNPSKIKNQNQPIFVLTHPRSKIKINPSSSQPIPNPFLLLWVVIGRQNRVIG
jgi:hypothetical protein